MVELLLRRIRESMAERELQLELSDEMKEMLVEKGWDPAMGARPLRRAIQRYIEDPLADFVLREQVPSGSTVMVEALSEQTDGEERSEEDDVKLTVIAPKPKPTPVGVAAERGPGAGFVPSPRRLGWGGWRCARRAASSGTSAPSRCSRQSRSSRRCCERSSIA